MMNAFDGKAEVQAQLLGRLAKHADAKHLVLSSFRWNGEQGSLVGCLIETAEAGKWESELGLPQWLAVAADRLAEGSGSPENAALFGTRLLNAIRPGADLQGAGSRFILQLLEDLKPRLTAPDGKAVQALADVEHLHRSVAVGEPPAPPEWRVARRAATAATDEASDEQVRALLACVETAAWNPATSPVVVYDTLRTWVSARTLAAAIAAGWRTDYEPTLRAHLQELFDAHLKDNPELQKTVTVFDLLREHYPADERMLRNKNQIDQKVPAEAYPQAADMLLNLLKAA